MIDASFAGLLDDHECPICGAGQLIDVAESDDESRDGSAARICLGCERAIFVDPVIVPAATVLTLRRGRSSRSSAA